MVHGRVPRHQDAVRFRNVRKLLPGPGGKLVHFSVPPGQSGLVILLMGRVHPRERGGQGAGGAFHIGRGVPPVGIVGAVGAAVPVVPMVMVCGVRRHGNVRNGGPQVQNLRPAAQRVFQLGKVRLQILAGGQNQARLPCGGDILRSGFKAVQVAMLVPQQQKLL